MIYLIRHGQTEANIKHIYCGSTDLPLSETGVEKLIERRETAALAELRAKAATDAAVCGAESSMSNMLTHKVTFITSGMKRTVQTLELLFGDGKADDSEAVESVCDSESAAHFVDPRFREIDFGIFEMQGYDDLKDTPEYQEWISGDNEVNVCPGGESGRQMEVRVMEAFSELREFFMDDSGRDAVVVTHGGVIAAIMNNLFPEENKSRFDWQPAPGCGYVIVKESEYMEL